MNVLVVGSVPPPKSDRRMSLLSSVLALRAAGETVEVVSPDPLSASHRHLNATGVGAAVEIGLAARRADRVVVQIEPGLPVGAQPSRPARALGLLALAAALRRAPKVTLRLDHPDDLPGGPGGRAALELWKSATRIEAGSEAVRDELVAVLGPLSDRVVLAESASETDLAGAPRGDVVEARSPADWGEGADVTAASVMGVIRRRAAAERVAIAGRAAATSANGSRVAAAPPSERVALWQWLPWPGAGVPDVDGGTRSAAGRPSMARRVLVPVLAAAERRPATRPAAVLARGAWSRLKPALRR